MQDTSELSIEGIHLLSLCAPSNYCAAGRVPGVQVGGRSARRNWHSIQKRQLAEASCPKVVTLYGS
jgi:hypothetical protein